MITKNAGRRVNKMAHKLIAVKEDMDVLSWTRVIEVSKLIQIEEDKDTRYELAEELRMLAQMHLSVFGRMGITLPEGESQMLASGIEVGISSQEEPASLGANATTPSTSSVSAPSPEAHNRVIAEMPGLTSAAAEDLFMPKATSPSVSGSLYGRPVISSHAVEKMSPYVSGSIPSVRAGVAAGSFEGTAFSDSGRSDAASLPVSLRDEQHIVPQLAETLGETAMAAGGYQVARVPQVSSESVSEFGSVPDLFPMDNYQALPSLVRQEQEMLAAESELTGSLLAAYSASSSNSQVGHELTSDDYLAQMRERMDALRAQTQLFQDEACLGTSSLNASLPTVSRETPMFQSEFSTPGTSSQTTPESQVGAVPVQPQSAGITSTASHQDESPSFASPNSQSAAATFSTLYQSKDGNLCLFQDGDGHLVAVDANKLV